MKEKCMINSSAVKKALAVAAAGTLLIGATSACSAPLPDGKGSCNFSFDNPHESHAKPNYIDGKTKVKCTVNAGSTLTNLSITTKLQQRSNGSWVDVAGSSNTTTKAAPRSGVTYTGVSGFITCRTGTFRTGGQGSAYLDGEFSGSTDWGFSNSVTNPCS